MRRWILPSLLGISMVVGIAPALAGGGLRCIDGHPEGSTTMVELVGSCFTPAVARVDPGSTVAFVDLDDQDHDISALDWGLYRPLEPGSRIEMTFDEPGIYPFACSYHAGMTGAIVVGNGVRGPGAGSMIFPLVAGTALAAVVISLVRGRRSGG